MSSVRGSLWQETAPPGRVWPRLTGRQEVPVAIVGAGYSGLSTALRLARAGAAGEVVVLEAEQPGHGASGRNNGQVIPTLTRGDPKDMEARLGPKRGQDFAALVRESAASTFDLIRDEGIDCDAVQHGWVQPAHRRSRLAVQQERVRQWESLGARVTLLDAAELERRVGIRGYHGGWIAADGGHINPLAYARGLAAAVADKGVGLYARSRVTAIERQQDRWLLRSGAGEVLAEQVLLATAAYTDALWPALARTVVPVRAYQAATQPVGRNLLGLINPENLAVSDTRADLRFFRYDRDHRLVSGGALMLRRGSEAKLVRLVADRLAAAFPELGTVSVTHAWNGFLAVNPEHFPHIYELGPGLWSWIGCNGRGVALATAMGGVMARLLEGADPASLPLPVERPRPLPLHGLKTAASRAMLPLYRWRDARD